MPENEDIDLQIVEFLRRDGTLTNAAISEKLGVSEATIRRRRQRLEDEGYIRIIASANPMHQTRIQNRRDHRCSSYQIKSVGCRGTVTCAS